MKKLVMTLTAGAALLGAASAAQAHEWSSGYGYEPGYGHSRVMVREGYRVTVAKDGLEGLEKLSQERPAVLLTDIDGLYSADGAPADGTIELVEVLERAGLSIADMGACEVNEAFASVVLKFLRDTGADWCPNTSVQREALSAGVRKPRRGGLLDITGHADLAAVASKDRLAGEIVPGKRQRRSKTRADGPGQGSRREHGVVIDRHGAGAGLQLSAEDLEEGRLAAAVGADEAVAVAAAELDGNVLEQR